MSEEPKQSTENASALPLPSTVQKLPLDNPSIEAAVDTDVSNSSKKQKKTEETTTIPTASDNTLSFTSGTKLKDNNQSTGNSGPLHYQDISFHGNTKSYCSFTSTDKKPLESFSKTKTESSPSNPVQQFLNHVPTDIDFDEEDEQKKRIAAAKRLLFPDALGTSFPEVADTLRNERRQEFCPIYNDETPEQKVLRQTKQKPIGSLLAKRIRWDDLKRKREEDEKKAQMQYHYGPYGPVYHNQQLFANPYEQYYTAMQHQYDLMAKMTHAQQEHSGFWPEYYQQASFQNNGQPTQNSMQHQPQPYTYPYPSMNSNYMTAMNTNLPSSSYTPADYDNLYRISQMPPPPPPPDEP